MPSDSNAQPCEVCGVDTTSRCSSCQLAGLDLFFCSREHQKLVWPAHKLVCGPGKALPFAVQPLTDSELAAAVLRLDEVSIVQKANAASLRRRLEKMSQRPVEYVLEHLGGDIYDTSKLADKPVIALFVRCAVSASRPIHLDLGDRGSSFFNVSDASHCCAEAASCAIDWLAAFRVLPRRPQDQAWFSLLLHKAWTLSRLLPLAWHAYTADPPDMSVVRLYSGARKRFVEWVQRGMGTRDPRFAEALRAYDSFLLQRPPSP